jgi:hypothetical protein
MKNIYKIILILLIPILLNAQTRVANLDLEADERGKPELVVCSQNLNNYGQLKDVSIRVGLSKQELADKEVALVQRFNKAKCDVIAVQEILAKDEILAETVLTKLAKAYQKISLRPYEVKVGASNDPKLRNGYIVAKNRARIINSVSYVNVELPKISQNQKQRYFSRGPLELQLEVFPKDEAVLKTVTLVNFHFKSKSGQGGYDPTGLEYEPYRMEMSEALRRIIKSRHAQSLNSNETILVVLGDRNSHFDSASARILEGKLKLSDFQDVAACRLSKRGVPLCKTNTSKPNTLTSVLTTNSMIRNFPGTIRYKDTVSWIDDILLPTSSLPYAWDSSLQEGSYKSGVVYEPKVASDHALIWVELNW